MTYSTGFFFIMLSHLSEQLSSLDIDPGSFFLIAYFALKNYILIMHLIL